MKRIETIYACITREGDEETICGFGDANGMQAISSNHALIEHVLTFFKKSFPAKDFYIICYERKKLNEI